MAHQSLSKAIKDTIRGQETGEITTDQLSRLLHIQTRKDNKRMLNTLSELYRTGKISRVRQGVYGPALTGAAHGNQPDKREIMWRVLRMRRSVTIADLQEMAGVSDHYAGEWLLMLTRRGIVQVFTPVSPKSPVSWRLISDVVEMPVDTAKAERLRNLRLKKKKQAITQQLGVIGTALGEVREILKTMEDEA